MPDFRPRIAERFAVDLAATICIVITVLPARIVDLSPHGAKIESSHPYPAGQKITLEFQGDRVFATVTWSEIDRMGVKFCETLKPGCWRDALDVAMRATRFRSDSSTRDTREGKVAFGRRAA